MIILQRLTWEIVSKILHWNMFSNSLLRYRVPKLLHKVIFSVPEQGVLTQSLQFNVYRYLFYNLRMFTCKNYSSEVHLFELQKYHYLKKILKKNQNT